MAEVKSYLVHYMAIDGEICSFKFKTDRSFRTYSRYDMDSGIGLGRPFQYDMYEAATRIESNPESRMAKHGGFNAYKIRRIKCIETGETKYFSC